MTHDFEPSPNILHAWHIPTKGKKHQEKGFKYSTKILSPSVIVSIVGVLLVLGTQ